MKFFLSILSAIIISFMCAPFCAHAQVPSIMPLQGVLVDSDGNAVDGNHSLTFALYTNETGEGDPLYIENHTTVSFQNGAFTVYLGNAENSYLDLDLFNTNPNLWIQVTIDNTETLAPLIRLATVPYAAYAQQCDNATTLAGQDASVYATVGQSISGLGTTCAETGYVPQWNSALQKWSCSKISTDTTFTGDDAINAVASAGFIKDTDVEEKARAVCYDPTDTDGSIPPEKVDLSTYASRTWVNTQMSSYMDQSSVNNAISTAIDTYSQSDVQYSDANALAAVASAGYVSGNTQSQIEDYARNACYDPTDTIPMDNVGGLNSALDDKLDKNKGNQFGSTVTNLEIRHIIAYTACMRLFPDIFWRLEEKDRFNSNSTCEDQCGGETCLGSLLPAGSGYGSRWGDEECSETYVSYCCCGN